MKRVSTEEMERMKKWIEVLNIMDWNKRDWMWFKLLIACVMFLAIGCASLSIHNDELAAENKKLNHIIESMTSNCEGSD